MTKKSDKSKRTPIRTQNESIGMGEIGHEILDRMRLSVMNEIAIFRIRIFREFRNSAIAAMVILCLTVAAVIAFFVAAILGLSHFFDFQYWTSTFIVGGISIMIAVFLNYFAFQVPADLGRTAAMHANETLKRR